MIVESIVIGVSAIFISTLVFAERLMKRQRQWDLEDTKEPEPKPVIYPFIKVVLGTECPKCGYACKNQVIKETGGYSYLVSEATGPGLPRACYEKDCKARNLPHLHAYCNTCKYSWFMAPADHVEKKKRPTESEMLDELFDDKEKEEKEWQQDTPTK